MYEDQALFLLQKSNFEIQYVFNQCQVETILVFDFGIKYIFAFCQPWTYKEKY